MTKFAIVDVESMVIGEINGKEITIKNNGGCPAADILRGLRHFSDPSRLATAMLNRWVGGAAGYEGGWAAAKENELYVSIDDGEAIARA